MDRAAAGTISATEFVSQLDALSTTLQGEIQNAVGTPGSTPAAASSGGDSGFPYPLNQWWFWIFVAPEAAGLVFWLVWIVLIAPVVLGAEAVGRRRERRRERRGESS